MGVRKNLPFLFTMTFLGALILASVQIVWASETVPWGVERVGARCVWDKDWNKAVDVGANAGNLTGNVTVAIVDFDGGIDRDHPDLVGNIAGGVKVYYDEF